MAPASPRSLHYPRRSIYAIYVYIGVVLRGQCRHIWHIWSVWDALLVILHFSHPTREGPGTSLRSVRRLRYFVAALLAAVCGRRAVNSVARDGFQDARKRRTSRIQKRTHEAKRFSIHNIIHCGAAAPSKAKSKHRRFAVSNTQFE